MPHHRAFLGLDPRIARHMCYIVSGPRVEPERDAVGGEALRTVSGAQLAIYHRVIPAQAGIHAVLSPECEVVEGLQNGFRPAPE